MPVGPDRRSYDINASLEVQTNIQKIQWQLEHLIAARDTDVKAALSDFWATGVSDDYHSKEVRWQNTAEDARAVIHAVMKTLRENDRHAADALAKASGAVGAI